ncbi:hypothetical protein ACFWB1_01540 [Streptomyces goshikiensis]|uniref:hypothetical protein n=1 Tax=Streptomyces goshikiensis TaxID=1942 RepID=UPI003679D1FD
MMTGPTAMSSDLIGHLLLHRAIEVSIVIVALAVLALGMRVVWRKAGCTRNPED